LDYGGADAIFHINSDSLGMEFRLNFLSVKYFQKETFNLRHVFFRDVKIFLLFRADKLLVPALTLRQEFPKNLGQEACNPNYI